MKFIKQTDNLAEILAEALNDALSKSERVIWLVPGGSNVKISVAAMRQIDDDLSSKLVVMQTDERYVALDSPDNNWYELGQSGFETKQAVVYPISRADLDLEQTVENYAKVVERQLELADYIVGQFGIGVNGHTAGIMPSSEAAKSEDLVIGYEADDFKRVTLGFRAIRQIDAAYTFAFGADKLEALENLKSASLSLEVMPSGILKEIDPSVVYNDQVEGEN